jgi:hypothetical protein
MFHSILTPGEPIVAGRELKLTVEIIAREEKGWGSEGRRFGDGHPRSRDVDAGWAAIDLKSGGLRGLG